MYGRTVCSAARLGGVCEAVPWPRLMAGAALAVPPPGRVITPPSSALVPPGLRCSRLNPRREPGKRTARIASDVFTWEPENTLCKEPSQKRKEEKVPSVSWGLGTRAPEGSSLRPVCAGSSSGYTPES